MGSIYRRHNSLWVKYKNRDGDWRCQASGFKVGDERKAQGLLVHLENLVKSGVDVVKEGPMTVERWSRLWLESRRVKGVVIVDDYESRLKNHILPHIGALKLRDVLPVHIEELVRSLRNKRLAPRTVRNIYFQAHAMFGKAIRKGHLTINPCNLDEDDLPAKMDKDPEWRATAIYARSEVVQIISDERIPKDRRMLDALLFLAGIRFGEAAALRWHHYDGNAEPLGRLTIAKSYNTKLKIEKSVKTKVPRAVPVHPALAALLAEWRLGGWSQLMGREPRADDLIVPSRLGNNRSANHMLKKFHEDLERLGLRVRRQHDLRRTFISLCLGDGASKDIRRWITHAPEGDVVDDYTTLVWQPLCREVAKLQISLPKREQTEVAKSSNSLDQAGAQATYRATCLGAQTQNPSQVPEFPQDFVTGFLRGGRDLNPRPPA
jgi:integrase